MHAQAPLALSPLRVQLDGTFSFKEVKSSKSSGTAVELPANTSSNKRDNLSEGSVNLGTLLPIFIVREAKKSDILSAYTFDLSDRLQIA